MKNIKGFTLIELLSTILILGIIIVIAVPFISYLINGNNKEYYSGLEKMILSSGKDYFMDNRSVLPKEIKTTSAVSLKTLIEDSYIDQVKDKDGNYCTGNVIATKKDNSEYEYVTCLICGSNYITDGCDENKL